MLDAYREHVAERAAQNIPPTPLSPEQVAELVELIQAPPAGDEDFLIELLTDRVPPGVDEAAYVKAGFLSSIAKAETACALINREQAVTLLGNMLGGYNIGTLIALLDDAEVGASAARELKRTILVFDAFHDVQQLAESGSKNAQSVLESWAAGEWFTDRPEVADSLKMVVFKVTG
jgi:aconitate hydratase 2/2-methylisocitrate dehydratase